MLIIDIIYLIFLLLLLFIIIYKGFSITARSSEHENNFNFIRDELYYNRHCLQGTDRQSNNSSQANELRRDNRCNDIFFIEPNSLEAARIRAQLEKDDKELPSYDEVMRIANLPTATASPAANNLINSLPCVVSNAASSSSVNTTNTTLTAPAYTEAGPNLRPLTPPPYTPEPIGATMVLPIATPLHAQRNAQNS